MRRALMSLIGAAAMAVAVHPTVARAQAPSEPAEVPAPVPPNEHMDPNACPPGTTPVEPNCPPEEAAQTPYPVYPAPAKRRAPWSPYQTAISLGGGAANFIRDRISDNTETAGAWDARLLIGTRSILAGEATYLGSAQSANDPFSGRTVSTTQVYGSARLNGNIWRVQPFVTAGVGWANLHRWGNANDSPVASSNFGANVNSVMVPFSGGLATYFGQHGTIDARFNYQLITSKDFTPTGARPDMWVAELRAGYAF